MFSTLLMGGGGHAREKDHQNVKSLIIFARDCRSDLGRPFFADLNFDCFDFSRAAKWMPTKEKDRFARENSQVENRLNRG
jgi:hypothetical protein